MNTKIPNSVKQAFMIGAVCSVSYLGVYIARNILGAVTPQMIELGVFTTESIGALSSIYFITYAIGQLINGIIGDRIKAKYMISLGLILSGVCNLIFSLTTPNVLAAYTAYGATGFFLSMIYAPMVRVIAENTEATHATRCILGLTFASFMGSPLAGVLAGVMHWEGAFAFSSTILLAMGTIYFLIFTLFEKNGIVRYNQINDQQSTRGSVKVLIRHRIIKFSLISILTGVVRTTVVFWMPTYISQHLGFSTESSAFIFTVATFAISLSAFITVIIFEMLGRDMDKTILLGFLLSTICFILVYFTRQPIINIVCLVLAIMASNVAASMLWNNYCPSLRETGMVSSATGYLDFLSYMAASVSSSLFANAVSEIGWSNLILIWFGLMLVGTLISIPLKKR